jgi:hypothetical protein
MAPVSGCNIKEWVGGGEGEGEELSIESIVGTGNYQILLLKFQRGILAL